MVAELSEWVNEKQMILYIAYKCTYHLPSGSHQQHFDVYHIDSPPNGNYGLARRDTRFSGGIIEKGSSDII